MKIKDIKPKPVVCRQSTIKCALACKRKWFYRYRLGIRLRGGEAGEAATLGRIYHKFQQLGPGHDDEVRAWIRGKQAALMARVDKGEDLNGSMKQLANLMTELYHKAEVMAHLFWEKYPQPDYLRTIGTEIKVSSIFGFKGDEITLEGTIDKLLENEQDGNRWIRDHKSTGLSLEHLFGGLMWDIQARLYRLLATEYLGGPEEAKLKGFIMDGILKPGIKLCGTDEKNTEKWDCSIEEAYLRRVRKWYDERGVDAIRSKALIYNEPLMPQDMLSVYSEMLYLSALPPDEPELFPRDVTRTACFQYNRKCVYHDLCDSPVKRWDELLETKYEIKDEED